MSTYLGPRFNRLEREQPHGLVYGFMRRVIGINVCSYLLERLHKSTVAKLVKESLKVTKRHTGEVQTASLSRSLSLHFCI